MFERGSMSVVNFERCDGNRAFADGRLVRVRLDAFDELLLAKPKIAATAGIRSGQQNIPGDL